MGIQIYKPIIIMIGCQFIYAGTTLFGRAALLEDMSSRVFVVYRQSIAFLFVAPFAFLSRERSGCRLGWRSFWWIFVLAFFGVTANQTAKFEGLALISSSVASAMYTLSPAITFIIVYIMGLEKINLASLRSIAKIIGTLLCVFGGIALALLRGPKLLNRTSNPGSHRSGGGDEPMTWLLGCFFLLLSASSWSFSLILQVPVTARYKDQVSLTAWMSLMAALQSGAITLIFEPNMKAWKMSSPLQLFCCFYAGMASAVTFFAQVWCIKRRGPLFSAMFQPLYTVIVTAFACIFMHEELYTGSLFGGVVAICGLYIMLWGKAKDNEDVKDETVDINRGSESCKIDLEQPLSPKSSPSTSF